MQMQKHMTVECMSIKFMDETSFINKFTSTVMRDPVLEKRDTAHA